MRHYTLLILVVVTLLSEWLMITSIKWLTLMSKFVSVQGNERPFRFFVYEVTSTKFTRELVKEILISLVASVFMGLGTMFLLLWVGIYV